MLHDEHIQTFCGFLKDILRQTRPVLVMASVLLDVRHEMLSDCFGIQLTVILAMYLKSLVY